MRVYEIFRSIQGETTRAGLPMWFVRVAGCDMACLYCDTPAARDPKAGRDMAVADVLDAIAAPPLPWCMITGGEPMLQVEEVNGLAAALAERGVEVLIETSGGHPIERLESRARRIVDVKTPGSGMHDRMHWPNLERLRPTDEVKFVLTGRADYEWAKEAAVRHGLLGRVPALFSPAEPQLAARDLARWLVEDAFPARLNIQIHKILGLP